MQDLLTFLGESPSRFHAVENLRLVLEGSGYVRLGEREAWNLSAGGKYYVIRNGSSLIAFRIPKADFSGFMISASHSDRPAFRVKENPELTGPGTYVRLNTERYGGQILHTWMDRPLTVAGRVLAEDDGTIRPKLVYVDKDLLMIPSVVPHMSPGVNDGFKPDPRTDLVPLMAIGADAGAFRDTVAEAAGCRPEDILGTDLFLCLRQKPVVWGPANEFISAQALDDLQCAYACFSGFLDALDSGSVPVYAILDSEEIGSRTRQGAGGTFLSDTVDRICAVTGRDRTRAAACSFLVSADNSHAVHPNRPELSDPTNRPVMNGGPVIKSGVRYATDGASGAVFATICRKAGVPFQYFANRSDIAGGGTLGCVSIGQLSVSTVDVGLPQLAMHSCFETAGSRDADYLTKAIAAACSSSVREEADGRILII